MDNLDQALFSCEIELDNDIKDYKLEIPSKILVKGFYKLNCIIYHPAVTQYDVVSDCCSFSIIDNVERFSHLETFDIGKVYVPHKWQ
jgi:lipopolysaccharide transport system ATP-binding protein